MSKTKETLIGNKFTDGKSTIEIIKDDTLHKTVVIQFDDSKKSIISYSTLNKNYTKLD